MLVERGLAVTNYTDGFVFNKRDSFESVYAQISSLMPDLVRYMDSVTFHDDLTNPDYNAKYDPSTREHVPWFHLLAKEGSYGKTSLAILPNDFPNGADLSQHVCELRGGKKSFQYSAIVVGMSVHFSTYLFHQNLTIPRHSTCYS